jgi:threonine dehydrogenase-like Zn-dependent dehydrogenase
MSIHLLLRLSSLLVYSLPMKEICTHQFPLSKWKEAFDLVADYTGGSVKVSLVPSMG